MKKILCLILAFLMLPSASIGVLASGEATFLNETFENTWGSCDYSGNLTFAQAPDISNGTSACFAESGGTMLLGKRLDAPLPAGRQLIEFDFYAEGLGCPKYVRILGENSTGIGDSNNFRYFLTIRNDSKIGIRRTNNTGYDAPENYIDYETDRWNNIKIWIDTEYGEAGFFLNDELITYIPYTAEKGATRGISICKYEGTADMTDKFYIDNLKITAEDDSASTGFFPVYIKAEAKEGIVGNNFYADNMPEFNISFKNRLSTGTSCDISYKAKDSYGNTVWENEDVIELSAKGEAQQSINISARRFGVMELEITILADGKSFTKKVPYTLSNHTADMPGNMRAGTSAHISSGREGIDETAALLKGAGIGNLRDESLGWGTVEYEQGKYALTDNQEKLLDTMSQNGIDYMFLFNAGHPDYAAATNRNYLPFADSTGYTALKNYITKLVELADGRLKYIEVLNEVHAKVGQGDYDAQLVADIHKYIYQGVQAANDERVKVVGIDEDSFAMNVSDFISGYLEKMNGEKVFDAVSLHPYPRLADGPPYYLEGSLAADTFVNRVRTALENNGYSKDTPILFSEIGWSELQEGMDVERQAAYTVRSHAYTWAKGLADIVYTFTLCDNMKVFDTALDQAGFGMMKSYTDDYTEVPYLGKPVYCAYAYYNNLMANAEFKGETALGVGSSYCYNYTDRHQRNIMMLGMLEDNAEAKVYINTGEEKVIIADMYGNEEIIPTVDGVVEIKLCDKPQYIISNIGNSEVADEIESFDRPVAILDGVSKSGKSGEDVTVTVLREGYSLEDVTEDNIGTAFYYYNQTKTGADGAFSFAIPINNGCDSLCAYVQCGDETEKRVYDIYEKQNYVLARTQISEDGDFQLTATAFLNEGDDASKAVMAVVTFEDNRFCDVQFTGQSYKNSNIIKFRTVCKDNPGKNIKCLFWIDFGNLVPIDAYTVLQ